MCSCADLKLQLETCSGEVVLLFNTGEVFGKQQQLVPGVNSMRYSALLTSASSTPVLQGTGHCNEQAAYMAAWRQQTAHRADVHSTVTLLSTEAQS